jgi:hypothetical protein
MATKENRGGLLSNEQVEEDLVAKGRTETGTGYRGIQDTGDNEVRQQGTDVQKADGQPQSDEAAERKKDK